MFESWIFKAVLSLALRFATEWDRCCYTRPDPVTFMYKIFHDRFKNEFCFALVDPPSFRYFRTKVSPNAHKSNCIHSPPVIATYGMRMMNYFHMDLQESANLFTWWRYHKGQWRRDLMLSFICAWTYDWVNNRDGGDFRSHRVHLDVILMNHEGAIVACRLPNIRHFAWISWFWSGNS